jgi:hypothetical protein
MKNAMPALAKNILAKAGTSIIFFRQLKQTTMNRFSIIFIKIKLNLTCHWYEGRIWISEKNVIGLFLKVLLH